MADEPDREKPPALPDAPADAEPMLNRRTFGTVVLGAATTGYAGAIGYPVARYLLSGAEIADDGPPVTEVQIGKPDDIAPGTGKNFAFGAKPALVIRGKDGKFTAFFATCSHLGCTVALEPSTWLIRCPCHGGTYDPATGKNVGGPPPKPLEPLRADVEKDKLVIRKRGA